MVTSFGSDKAAVNPVLAHLIKLLAFLIPLHGQHGMHIYAEHVPNWQLMCPLESACLIFTLVPEATPVSSQLSALLIYLLLNHSAVWTLSLNQEVHRRSFSKDRDFIQLSQVVVHHLLLD